MRSRAILAAHVGVHVAPDRSIYRCDRCGITRPYRAGRGRLCRDCQDVLALTECEATTPSAQKGTTA